MRIFSLLFLTVIIGLSAATAQDLSAARKHLEKLTSKKFAGRGYVKNGDKKAAAYIASCFEKYGLQPAAINGSQNYYDTFHFNINIFPGKAEVITGKLKLKTGIDFAVDASAPSVKGNFKVVFITREMLSLSDEKWMGILSDEKISGCALVIDTPENSNVKIKDRITKLIYRSLYPGPVPAVVIKLTPKQPIWTARQFRSQIAVVEVVASRWNRDASSVTVNIESEFTEYVSQNVIGVVKGKKVPDSLILVSAHYDHLGMMGSKVVYPGANDNASGTAMLLDLARKFSRNPGDYTMVFIAFSGEEAGLIGSYHLSALMASLPSGNTFHLGKVKFMLNLDLMGAGEKGVMAVNGEVFTEQFNLLKSINEEGSYLPFIGARGKAANSDHYWFTEAGVPAFFFYLMGDYPYYHVPQDKAAVLPFRNYENAFRLFEAFLRRL